MIQAICLGKILDYLSNFSSSSIQENTGYEEGLLGRTWCRFSTVSAFDFFVVYLRRKL